MLILLTARLAVVTADKIDRSMFERLREMMLLAQAPALTMAPPPMPPQGPPPPGGPAPPPTPPCMLSLQLIVH